MRGRNTRETSRSGSEIGSKRGMKEHVLEGRKELRSHRFLTWREAKGMARGCKQRIEDRVYVQREKNKKSYARSGRLSRKLKEQCIEKEPDGEKPWNFDMKRGTCIPRGRKKRKKFTAPAQVSKNILLKVERVQKRT